MVGLFLPSIAGNYIPNSRWKAPEPEWYSPAFKAMSYCGVVEMRSLEDALGATWIGT